MPGLETSACSAQLARLGERGVVQVAGGSARRKQYYLTERPVQHLLPAAAPSRAGPAGRSPHPLHGVLLLAA